jgi:hypothetical protein
MPARYKLTLDSLKFISLVDRPAQETAKVLLVKRAGNPDVVKTTATARVMKVGAGDNPLIYCWAFTCTDDTGAPYHDLQGDAMSPDFVKAAEEYLAANAPSDEMHDENATGRIAFGFPMDGDIAKAFFGEEAGSLIKTSGLMVAVRASKEALEKVRSGEYTGVSIAGTGTRELVKTDAAAKRKKLRKPPAPPAMASSYKRVGKMATLTSVDEGHQHSIDLQDPACSWSDMLLTSHQTAEGAEGGHNHAWVYDATTGRITIALDSGHTHTVDAVVPADVIAEAGMEDEPTRCCVGCGYGCAETDAYCPRCGVGCGSAPATTVGEGGEPSGKTVVVITNAAPPVIGNSTPAHPNNTVKSQEPSMPTEQDTQIASLRKMLSAALALTEPQRLHVAKQAPADVEVFLTMDASARDAVVKAADLADPVVHTTAAGLEVRKSHGPLTLELAKQADAQAKAIAEQTTALSVAKAAGEVVEFQKAADVTLKHFSKSIVTRGRLMKAVKVEFGAVQAEYDEAIECLKGGDFAIAKLGKPVGADDISGPKPDDPKSQLDELAKKHAATNNVTFAKAFDAVLQTTEGAALYTRMSTPGAN